jgi:serine/threonine protein phosphatase PrpC
VNLAQMFTTTSIPADPGRKPRDSELDLFGLTHRGLVRKENQDHFLVSTVHQQVVVHGTSLPDPEGLPLRGERLGTLMLVADGVGSGAGEDASRLAVATVTEYASDTMRCFHQAGRAAEQAFFDALKAAALKAHDAVRAEAATREGIRSMATTLTLILVVWPTMYVTQVGDSRCYVFLDDTLQRVTRDQTLAQDLVDRGALPADRAAASPFSSVLASAIGGKEALPVVQKVELRRGCVVLLCSDGLTKHVTDPEIEAVLRGMTSSEQACRALVDLALERGGSDNVTVLIGRARWEEIPA